MAVRYHKVKETSYQLVTLVMLLIFVALGAYMYFTRPDNTEVKSEVAAETNQEPVVNAVEGNFALSINKLNVSVPVIENVDGTNRAAYDEALTKGVAHYKGTSLPGDGSNVFIFGHSSALDENNVYGKIFATLNELADGDDIVIRYNDQIFDYTVTDKKVVMPEDLWVLDQTSTEQLTLMTCWPIGSNEKRLVVIAELNKAEE